MTWHKSKIAHGHHSRSQSESDCCQMVKNQIKGDMENSRREIEWAKKHGQPNGQITGPYIEWHTGWLKALKNIRKYVVAHQKSHDKEAFKQFLTTERDRSARDSGEWHTYNEYLDMATRF